MNKIRKVLLFLIMFLSFFVLLTNIKAEDCGSEYKKIKDEPREGTCQANKIDGTQTTLPIFTYKCSQEEGFDDSTGVKVYSQYPKMHYLNVYKGTKDSHDSSLIFSYTFIDACKEAGSFQTDKPLEENQSYYVEYGWGYTKKTCTKILFFNKCSYEGAYGTRSFEFATKASETTKAPAKGTCSISIPKEQVDTVSFVAKYKCDGDAKATSYEVFNGNDSIESKTIKKKYNTSDSLAIKSLTPGTTYKITLHYELDGKSLTAEASESTKKESETSTQGIEYTQESKSLASKAKLNASDVTYDSSKGHMDCGDLSVKDLIDEYWSIVMVLVPIVLMLLISIDFIKALTANDQEQLKKSGNSAIKRTIAAVILLMLPALLSMILGWFGLELCI